MKKTSMLIAVMISIFSLEGLVMASEDYRQKAMNFARGGTFIIEREWKYSMVYEPRFAQHVYARKLTYRDLLPLLNRVVREEASKLLSKYGHKEMPIRVRSLRQANKWMLGKGEKARMPIIFWINLKCRCSRACASGFCHVIFYLYQVQNLGAKRFKKNRFVGRSARWRGLKVGWLERRKEILNQVESTIRKDVRRAIVRAASQRPVYVKLKQPQRVASFNSRRRPVRPRLNFGGSYDPGRLDHGGVRPISREELFGKKPEVRPPPVVIQTKPTPQTVVAPPPAYVPPPNSRVEIVPSHRPAAKKEQMPDYSRVDIPRPEVLRQARQTHGRSIPTPRRRPKSREDKKTQGKGLHLSFEISSGLSFALAEKAEVLFFDGFATIWLTLPNAGAIGLEGGYMVGPIKEFGQAPLHDGFGIFLKYHPYRVPWIQPAIGYGQHRFRRAYNQQVLPPNRILEGVLLSTSFTLPLYVDSSKDDWTPIFGLKLVPVVLLGQDVVLGSKPKFGFELQVRLMVTFRTPHIF